MSPEDEGISITQQDWMDIVGYLIKNSGKIRSPHVFRYFEDRFNEDFTKNKLHEVLRFLNENGNLKYDDDKKMIWLGNKGLNK